MFIRPECINHWLRMPEDEVNDCISDCNLFYDVTNYED